MHNLPQPVRLCYFASIFRYERPQAGRYRQHHQFGAEAIGDPDPAIDAEIIEMAWRLYQELGLNGLTLQLNSIGDKNCRPAYLEKLRQYYKPNLQNLCEDCKKRYERNTLRLLDCKKESCQPFIENAPKSADHLCEACSQHWSQLISYIQALGLPYNINHALVRGLDYYSRTVFEIQPPEEGAQSTIGGGGRYDGLIEELGGQPTPAVGFATGLERIVLNLKRQKVAVPPLEHYDVMIARLGEAANVEAVKLAAELRRGGIKAAVASGGRSLKAQMRQISALEAPLAIIIGDNELAQNSVALRDMRKAEQRNVSRTDLVKDIKEAVGVVESS
jgi:histidyl-tRNA synthetase